LKFAERAKSVVIKVRANEISATDDALINEKKKWTHGRRPGHSYKNDNFTAGK
jgi:hypothetical protein